VQLGGEEVSRYWGGKKKEGNKTRPDDVCVPKGQPKGKNGVPKTLREGQLR